MTRASGRELGEGGGGGGGGRAPVNNDDNEIHWAALAGQGVQRGRCCAAPVESIRIRLSMKTDSGSRTNAIRGHFLCDTGLWFFLRN